MSNFPIVVTLTGVSGSGKDTTVSRAIDRLNSLGIGWARGITTRAPRPGERSQYFDFVSEEEFVSMRSRGELIEWDEVSGNLYGTRNNAFSTSRNGPRGAIKIATIMGMKEIRKHIDTYDHRWPRQHTAIYLAVTEEDMCRRLREDRGWSDDKIRERLIPFQKAGYGPNYVPDKSEWDAIILNTDGNVAEAADKLVAVVQAAFAVLDY